MSRTTTKIIIRRENGEVVSRHALGEGEHFIGRDEESEIFIDDEFVSRQHARLIISADAIEIEDLKSTSGICRDRLPLLRSVVPIVYDAPHVPQSGSLPLVAPSFRAWNHRAD